MVCTTVFLASVFSDPTAATSFVLVYVFFSGLLGFQMFEYYYPANAPWLHAVQVGGGVYSDGGVLVCG